MIFWSCALVALSAALTATFVGDIRKAVLALWLCGLSCGGLFLFAGAEVLAVIQWIVSTLVAIGFFFYAVMFGEYGVSDPRPLTKRLASFAPALALGIAFSCVIVIGMPRSNHEGLLGDVEAAKDVERSPLESTEGRNMVALGKSITKDHLLSLEIMALTLFLVIVGSGVIARPEESSSEEAKISESEEVLP